MIKKWKKGNMGPSKAGGPPIYLLGFIGALLYYLNVAHGFGSEVVAVLKAIVWPAFLVYHLLGL